jgi:hypothetical protein
MTSLERRFSPCFVCVVNTVRNPVIVLIFRTTTTRRRGTLELSIRVVQSSHLLAA